MKTLAKTSCITFGLSALSLVTFSSSVFSSEPVLVDKDVKEDAKGSQIQADGSEEERYIIKFSSKAKKPDKPDKSDKPDKPDKPDKSDGQGVPDGGHPDAHPVFAGGKLDAKAARQLVKAEGGKPLKVLEKQLMLAAKMDRKAYNKLIRHPNVELIAADPKRHLLAQQTPYGINMIQASQLSQSNNALRTVCVIDTGYNLGHPDLPDQSDGVSGDANNNKVGSWNNDGHGHGTHVAGTIAALSNNEGVVGVYPGVDLHIVKIFDDNGNWSYASDLIGGVQQCADAGAQVVNMSLGGSGSSAAERDAMQGFADQGILLVAAAGNAGNNSLSYPASYDAVVSVAAVNANGNRASYSQHNAKVEIAAPGSSVRSTYPVNNYASMSGTSMATPHVAGGAALLWSYFTQCSNEEIRNAINQSAQDKGDTGRDNYYGYGILQVTDAHNYLNSNGCSGSEAPPAEEPPPQEQPATPVVGQFNNVSGSKSAWNRYKWEIPANLSKLEVRISGGSGDADLYVRYNNKPFLRKWDCRPYLRSNEEVCTINNPAPGNWYIGVRGFEAYSGVTLTYSYE